MRSEPSSLSQSEAPAALALRINAHIVDHGKEDCQLIGIEPAWTGVIPERRLGHMAKAVGVEISSGSGNDPRTLQRLPAEHPAIERGQQLALRKIASAAKDHKIERIDRNDSRNHDQSTLNRFSPHISPEPL